MIYLVFDTESQAYTANAVISLNMRLAGDVTKVWAELQQRMDGKWAIPKPEAEFMNYVEGGTEEEYSADWFPVIGG